MPKIENRRELDRGLAIATRSTGKKQAWYSLHYAPGGVDGDSKKKKQQWKSLGVEFKGSPYDEREAVKRAKENHSIWLADVAAGKSKSNFDLEFTSVAEEYLRYFKKQALHNQKLIDEGYPEDSLVAVDHGRGYYSLDRLKSSTQLLIGTDGNEGPIAAFMKTLPSQSMPKIRTIDLNEFGAWAQAEYEWSPSRIARAITEIRMVFNYAVDRDLIQSIPAIKRPRENLRARRRRAFTEKEYIKFIEHITATYNDYLVNPLLPIRAIDKWFQFLCFVQLIAFSGFRPPAGSVKKNMMRWEHYKVTNRGKDNEARTFIRVNEKGHDQYEAIIMKEVWPLLDALEHLYEKRDMKPEYLFEYTWSYARGARKGLPINNFRDEWEQALKGSGLHTEDERRSERLTPYSLRHLFITLRLQKGNVNVYRLSQITGTSIRMIQQTYDDFKPSEEFDRLTSGADAWGYQAIYDVNGNMVIT